MSAAEARRTRAAAAFRRLLPIGCVESLRPHPARSWRRLYADCELELRLSIDGRPLAVQTRDEDALRAAVLVASGSAHPS